MAARMQTLWNWGIRNGKFTTVHDIDIWDEPLKLRLKNRKLNQSASVISEAYLFIWGLTTGSFMGSGNQYSCLSSVL